MATVKKGKNRKSTKGKNRKVKVVRPTARLDWSMRNTGTVAISEFLAGQGVKTLRDKATGKTYRLDENGIDALCVLRPHGKEANGGLPIAKIVLAALKAWCKMKREQDNE